MLMSMVGAKALAHDIAITNNDGVTIYYNYYSDNEVEVSFKGSSYSSYINEYYGIVSIPESVSYAGIIYNVTCIGENAFRNCTNLTSLNIPNSVKSIGSCAFVGCTGLSSFVIPESITSIGNSAFSDCSNLTSVSIPNSVNNINSYAFQGCLSLSSVDIPSSVTNIGNGAFLGCTGLVSINIPISVTRIGDYAFYGCSRLKDVTLLEGISYIGANSFGKCLSLSSFLIPNSVKNIGKGVFEGCNNLTSIIVDNNNTVYDSRDNCNAIIETSSNTLISGCKNTQIPTNITTIGENAFYSCVDLVSIIIPNGVRSIDYGAFYGCIDMTSIIIPSSVTAIGDVAFADCSSLKEVVMGNSVETIGLSTFSGCSSLTSIVIPNSVTSIGPQAFQDCSNLSSITLSNKLKTIERGVFNGCKSLTSIIVPENVVSLGEGVFNGCSGLLTVIIPNNVTTIGNAAFYNCNCMPSVTIPASVTSIGSSAFYGCNSLLNVIVKNNTPVPIEKYTFSSRTMATLYVPDGSMAAYDAADYWTDFMEIVELNSTEPKDYTEIANNSITFNLIPNNDYTWSEGIDIPLEFINETLGTNDWVVYGMAMLDENGNEREGNAKYSKNYNITEYPGFWLNSDGRIVDWGNDAKFAISVGGQQNGKFSIVQYPDRCSVGEILRTKLFFVNEKKAEMVSFNVTCNIVEEIVDYDEVGAEDIVIPISRDGDEIIFDISPAAKALGVTVDDLLAGTNHYLKGMVGATYGKGVNAETGLSFNSDGEYDPYGEFYFWFDHGKMMTGASTDVAEDFSLPIQFCFNIGNKIYVYHGLFISHDINVSANTLSASVPTLLIGKQATLSLNLTNEDELIAFEFDLQLPDGITIAKDEDNDPIATLSSRCRDHSLGVSDQGNGLYHFLCYSNSNKVISGNEGELLTIELLCDGSVAVGTYQAAIKNIIFSDVDKNKITPADITFDLEVIEAEPGDVNKDGEINVMDVVEMVAYIMGDGAEGFVFAAADLYPDGAINVMDLVNLVDLIMNSSAANAREWTENSMSLSTLADGAVSVKVNNPEQYVASEFIVEVSAGQALETVTADKHHRVTCSQLDDSHYKVMTYSSANSTFNSDALVQLHISGEGMVNVHDALLVDESRKGVAFAPAVGGYTTGINQMEN